MSVSRVTYAGPFMCTLTPIFEMLELGHTLGQPGTIQRHQHRLNVQLYEGFQTATIFIWFGFGVYPIREPF